jgi:hypothetical protein
MKRLLKYYKEKKGITIVVLALFLAVLLFFLGMAVDISYMYFVRNQLHVAADAASLAGAAALDGCLDDSNITSSCPTLPHFSQINARQAAWKFACKNRVTGQPVYLVTNSSTDCDAPPASGLNEVSNTATGDIVVGHWRLTTSGVTCSTGWEPAGSGFFCPANGGTGLSINALKARPQRTDASATYGMPKARVFIGQVFNLIGINWGYLSARASAIAALSPPFIGPFPICLPSCSLRTPLDAQWDYDGSPIPGNDPKECTDQPGTPPGQKFFINPSATSDPDRPGIAWTDFSTDICFAPPDCPTSVQAKDVVPFIRGTATAPDLCVDNNGDGINDIFLCTTNATAFTKEMKDALSDRFEAGKKTYEFTAGSETFEVEGWQVYVPILSNLQCEGPPHTTCPGAMEYKVNPYQVLGFAKVIITEIITTGAHGFRLVGFNNPRTYTFSCTDKKGNTTVITRHITDIACIDCPEEPEEDQNVHLVK